MTASAEDMHALELAVARAERGAPQSVTLSKGGRAAIRELVIQGLLERAWLMLEDEHPIVRAAVRPKPDAERPTVFGILEDDHRRLDALAAALVETAGRQPEQSRSLIRDFVYGLRRHIRIEEELLFPIFDARSGMRGHGPTVVMRHEHALIVPQLERMERAAAAHAGGDASAWREIIDALREVEAVLGPHNVKEERVLYPMIDQLIPIGERADVLAQLVLWD